MQIAYAKSDLSETGYIERRAKLFEVGEYPDKGVSVTEAHLAEWQANFRGRVPILVEHAQSPLEIGFLADVAVEGSELYGTLHLTAEANALIERSGARGLSLGISGDFSEIREVSLVRHPRVADARLFARDTHWFDDAVQLDPEPVFDFHTEYARLRQRSQAEIARRTAESLLAQGYVTPAQMPYLKALLESDGVADFNQESAPVARLVAELLQAASPRNFTQPSAPRTPIDDSSHLMLPEEADFYRRHFPDVSLTDIAQRR